jgi:hypothetical protein
MTATYEKQKSEAQILAVEQYLTDNVLGDNFVCQHYNACKSSHPATFYEGQLHHAGKYYGVSFNGMPLRVVVVGQEYGHPPARVDCSARSKMFSYSALDCRFAAGQGYKGRNPHMKGTTSALRLIFGIPLGTDHNSEFLSIEGKRVHIFDAFALVNYLLCSAVRDGSTKGLSTETMLNNCRGHFRKVMHILEPSVIIFQGKGFWEKSIRKSFDSVSQVSDFVYKAKLGTHESFIAAFSHPAAWGSDNWGRNEPTEYLQNTVVPSIKIIHEHLGICG